MLDVHPPHHAATTWRDFFIHIATITVGLLIAVGLEQTVEALHHRHQLHELRGELHAESEKIRFDTTNTSTVYKLRIQWLVQRLEQVNSALAAHEPIPSLPDPTLPTYDIPDDPTWNAARSSGLLELMPEQEVKVFSEIGTLVDDIDSQSNQFSAATNRRSSMESQLTGAPFSGTQIANASTADLIEYQRLLREELAVAFAQSNSVGELHAAEIGILHGARSLEEVEQAERDAQHRADPAK